MTSELIALLDRRIGHEYDGECHLTEAEARRLIDHIASLEAALAEAREALKPFYERDMRIRHAHLTGHIHDDDLIYVRAGDMYAASDAFQGCAARASHEEGDTA